MVTPDRTKGGVSSATSFKILSFNANSIGRNPKRQKVLHFLQKKNPDFTIICDSRIAKNVENVIKEEWNGVCIFNSFTSQARGVAIFIKRGTPVNISDVFPDKDGNVLAVLMDFQGKKILLEGLYGPNADSPQFYSDVAFKKIIDWCPDFSIFAGDFNIALDPHMDTRNYLHNNNQAARKELLAQMETYNLVDIWRELHPQAKTFTWQKFHDSKCARLDYFLISSSLLPFVQKAEILPGVCSDHSVITLEIDFKKFHQGRGFWKFNSSLLKDPLYVMKIKHIIRRVVAQYAIINEQENFFEEASPRELQDFYETSTPESLQSTVLKVNPQSFLDVLLLEIRRETIQYSSFKKKERNTNEKQLLLEIESLEEIIASAVDNEILASTNDTLQIKKRTYMHIKLKEL